MFSFVAFSGRFCLDDCEDPEYEINTTFSRLLYPRVLNPYRAAKDCLGSLHSIPNLVNYPAYPEILPVREMGFVHEESENSERARPAGRAHGSIMSRKVSR